MIKINLNKSSLINADCLEAMRSMPDNCIDSVVTDAPYGLSFMGKKWDYDVPSSEIFKEILRVLKPGGHMLCACGTRTQHRMAVNIEDAGFEIRDVITWLYGSGFPKSMDISKAIDKQAGAEREVIGKAVSQGGRSGGNNEFGAALASNPKEFDVTAPATNAAKQWQGWGTALKPACEFWTLARKPLSEKTVAANVLEHGTGGINIDGCRVPSSEDYIGRSVKRTFPNGGPVSGNHNNDGAAKDTWRDNGGFKTTIAENNPLGRWPANLILDEEAAKVLDEQSGTLKSGAFKEGTVTKESENTCMSGKNYARVHKERAADSGGASRFFYVAKASKSERNAGLDEFDEVQKNGMMTGSGKVSANMERFSSSNQNFHPTVKPIKLMTYLVRLITPPNGICMDPFMGSGSTGVAAVKEGFGFIGIEREPAYFEICKARIEAAS